MNKTVIQYFLLFLSLSCKSQEQIGNENQILKHLEVLCTSTDYRNYQNIDALNTIAEYIHGELSNYCDTVYYHSFKVNGRTYKNVIGRIGNQNKNKLVIGAHYDVAGNQQGADDNASGVVGLLELARLLGKEKLSRPVEFVAFTLEEPPFFGTDNMGSYVYAKALHDKKEAIYGMLCLEMIGYFSEEQNSQTYPVKSMAKHYGTTGNFIAVVQKEGQEGFAASFADEMQKQELVKAVSIVAPKSVVGVDFSDHANFWTFGYNAVMVTNTAFYRNNNYHTKSDTIETLNIKKMSDVISQIYFSIKNICT